MSEIAPPIDVVVAGATGTVGQRFVQRLAGHPYFNVVAVAASDNSAGRPYGEAVKWELDTEIPPAIAGMEVLRLGELANLDARAVFSAVPTEQAGDFETELADAGKAVFTNASPHRMDKHVPLLIPEVNADHISLIAGQNHNNEGFIIANANCGSIQVALAVAPIHRQWGIESMHVFTQQAISGASKSDLAAADLIDNIIPFIEGEEAKLRTEPAKMLGAAYQSADFEVTATATRVHVLDGHLITVHMVLEEAPESVEDIQAVLEKFRGLSHVQRLPSAPTQPIYVMREVDRPQPRRDRNRENGMAISVGRIRQAGRLGGKAVEGVILGHNAVRGAAGQSILNAELAYDRGLLYRP